MSLSVLRAVRSSWIPWGSKGCSKGCFMNIPHPTALRVCALHKCLSTSAGSLPLGYRVEETLSKLFTFSHGLEPKSFVFCLEASPFPQETWSCILPLQNGNGSHVHLLCYQSFGGEGSKGAPGLACSEKLPAPNLTVAMVTSACETPGGQIPESQKHEFGVSHCCGCPAREGARRALLS